MITIYPITGLGEVQPGADLGELIAGAMEISGLRPQAGDVLVVTQKIISKAENRYVSLASVTPGAEAERLAQLTGKDPRLVELVLAESSAIVRTAPNILITRHRLGHIMANAGIDRSNIGAGHGDQVLLLPNDPDASATLLRQRLLTLGVPIGAVVISDSFGRPWRLGVVNVAIGAAGFPALADRRGELDRDGRALEVTQTALGDMVASAAGLAMGEGAESVPAALLRGLALPLTAQPASRLVRPLGEDLFQ